MSRPVSRTITIMLEEGALRARLLMLLSFCGIMIIPLVMRYFYGNLKYKVLSYGCIQLIIK
jgi:hypothetical protein